MTQTIELFVHWPNILQRGTLKTKPFYKKNGLFPNSTVISSEYWKDITFNANDLTYRYANDIIVMYM